MEQKPFNATPLLFTTLLISICSIVYELIIGSLSSYLLGNSITQFSITIGLYLFAMGIGSYVSKYLNKHLFDTFTLVEILVGILGSFSSLLLFICHIYTNIYPLVMYLMILSIGLLVGVEIPLLVRIIEGHKQNIKSNIANLFAFDYIGGLIGSIAFPLLLLPRLGYVTTGFVTGLINLIAAAIIVFRYRDKLRYRHFFQNILFLCFAGVLTFTLIGDYLTENLESGLYRDKIVYTKQSLYQKIVLTKHKDDLRLFLDGNVQFSSADEYRYHEPLVHVPMAVNPQAKQVLLLGAGDGLAAKQLLRYPNVESITLIDLDEAVVTLCREHPEISRLNEGALSHPKVKVVLEDAFTYLERAENKYDVVIIDLPDPNNDALNKLYTTSFYRLVKLNLVKGGVMVTQSNSPYFTKNAFWCIYKTVGEEFEYVIPYHVNVPSFGDWGFNLATDIRIDADSLRLPPNVDYKYLNESNFSSLFRFANDEKVDLEKIKINTLFKPVLIGYYEGDIGRM
ncbi:polyamine aminopropyltransferase [Bacteroides sp. 224]|uniref:polyamine aminopropyltransferase n=1 Tax=Bacteroides sp. 224 TaxID=2302936 RepID=UPI0013D40BC1|nr:polyamine aminopropyltransferase [Bacteroides sp. 224]NDV65754.1 polyamine aminopropyltransferase [Bacteroides sp. 224]